MLTAMLDQETGSRGFFETRQRAFLAPWVNGDLGRGRGGVVRRSSAVRSWAAPEDGYVPYRVARGHAVHRSGVSVRALGRADAVATGVALRRPTTLADQDDRADAGARGGREARRGRSDAPAQLRDANRSGA